MVHGEGTVDFVGGDVVEALAFIFLRKGFPIKLCSLKESKGSHYIRTGESERILDRTVYMAFCCKVDDSIDLLILHKLIECLEVADIHLHELIVRLVLDVLEVCEVTCVGKLVEVDDIVFRIFVHKKANYM